MIALSNIVAGLALGAMGWRLLAARGRRAWWVGVMCVVTAVCLLVTGMIVGLGRQAALTVITAAGLWAIALRVLLAEPGNHKELALVMIAAGAVMAASAVLAVIA